MLNGNDNNKIIVIENKVIPSKFRLASYYFITGLGWLALVNEVIYAKFSYDENQAAIKKIEIIFFAETLPNVAVILIAGTASGLSLVAYLLAIDPIRDARELLSLKLQNNQLFYMKKSPTELASLSIGSHQQLCHFINKFSTTSLLFILPTICMGINFTAASSANWLAIYPYVKDKPELINYTLGVIIVTVGAVYFVLLSAKDVLDGARQLYHCRTSSAYLLFSLSKNKFFFSLTNFTIATSYATVTYVFIADELFCEILNQKDYAFFAQLFTGIASITVYSLTRLMPAASFYLKPYQNENGEIICVDEKLLNEFYKNLHPYKKAKLNFFAIPLGLIRGSGYGFLIYQLFEFYLKSSSLSGGLKLAIPWVGAVLISSALLFHSYSTTLNHYLSLAHKETRESVNIQSSAEKKNHWLSLLAFSLNLGSQVARSLLGIAAAIDLLGSAIGEENAAVLGMVITTERSWINLQYVGPKIEAHVRNFGKKVYNWRESWCGFYKRQGYEEILPTDGFQITQPQPP